MDQGGGPRTTASWNALGEALKDPLFICKDSTELVELYQQGEGEQVKEKERKGDRQTERGRETEREKERKV